MQIKGGHSEVIRRGWDRAPRPPRRALSDRRKLTADACHQIDCGYTDTSLYCQ